MAQAAKKTATSPKAKKSPAPKAALTVVDPVGNSGIPKPAPKGFNGRKVTLLTKEIPNRKIAGQALMHYWIMVSRLSKLLSVSMTSIAKTWLKWSSSSSTNSPLGGWRLLVALSSASDPE